MGTDLLAANDRLRLKKIPIPLLFCFSVFSLWQMGIVYFSSQALSLAGRIPLPVDVSNLIALFAAGYLVSIVLLLFLQKYTVLIGRITLVLSFAATLASLSSLPTVPQYIFFCIQIFCCVFLIGVTISVSVNALLVCGPCGILIAGLHNEFFPLDYTAFTILAALAQAMLLIFFFVLPTDVWPRPAARADGLQPPRRFAASIFVLIFLSCLVSLFGLSIADGVKHGISVYYLSCAAGVGLVYLLWAKKHVAPLQTAIALLAVSSFGFLLALISLQLPGFRLPACAVLGGGSVVCSLSSLFGVSLARRYPSRLVAPGITAVALLTVLLQSGLLELLRDDTGLLYIVCTSLALLSLIIFLLVKPSLLYSFEREQIDRWPSESPVPVPEPEPAAPDPSPFDILSGQELRLADFILQGYAAGEICRMMNITEGTMKGYRKTLYSKLDIHSRRELFDLADAQTKKTFTKV